MVAERWIGKQKKRARRSFTDEFRAGAVRLVLDEGKTVAQVARDLDLTASALANWVKQARADRSNGKTGLTTEERAGAGAAAQGEPRAADGARHPKKSRGLLREGERVKFALIEAEKASCPVAISCKALGVSRPGFYAWCRRTESTHAREDRRLEVLVRESHDRSRKTYGSPRVHAELAGEHVSRKRVIRLMQEQELKARVRRRYKCTTMSDHDQPVAANLLDRRFEAEAPNQRWVGDTTELLIGESGKLYLAAILDLFSRFVVGWAVSAVNDRHLTIKALEMALRRRCPGRRPAPPLRPGLHLRERGLPEGARGARHHLQHEPPRQLLRQRGDGELVLDAEVRARRALREPRPGQGASSSTTSRCSTTSSAGTRRWATWRVRAGLSNGGKLTSELQSVPTAFQTATGSRSRALPVDSRQTACPQERPAASHRPNEFDSDKTRSTESGAFVRGRRAVNCPRDRVRPTRVALIFRRVTWEYPHRAPPHIQRRRSARSKYGKICACADSTRPGPKCGA